MNYTEFMELNKIKCNELYSFYRYNNYSLNKMNNYYDIEDTEKIFSFSLFIIEPKNLTYFIGFVYNYAIMKKHFKEYTMRIYLDYHSIFGSNETYDIFNMFMDIAKDIDPSLKNLQLIVFYLNPYYDKIYDDLVIDIIDVREYYNDIKNKKSPLLNKNNKKNSITSNTSNLSNVNIKLDGDVKVEYELKNEIREKSKFILLS